MKLHILTLNQDLIVPAKLIITLLDHKNILIRKFKINIKSLISIKNLCIIILLLAKFIMFVMLFIMFLYFFVFLPVLHNRKTCLKLRTGIK